MQMLCLFSLSLLLSQGVADHFRDYCFMPNAFIAIPIGIDAKQAKVIERVKLLVSRDMGKTWTAVDELEVAMEGQKPVLRKTVGIVQLTTNGHFFRARTPGAYWFTLQAVNKDGTTNPKDLSKAPPGLKVWVLSTKKR